MLENARALRTMDDLLGVGCACRRRLLCGTCGHTQLRWERVSRHARPYSGVSAHTAAMMCGDAISAIAMTVSCGFTVVAVGKTLASQTNRLSNPWIRHSASTT